MKICFMFSGQGSQYVGMGKELYDNYPICKSIYEKADETLDIDVSSICFDENELINDTQYTQPSIFTTSFAIYKLLEEKGIKPDYMAGLSLGEYTALCASGAMEFTDCLKLVRKRGQLMSSAVPRGIGAMTAVLNTDVDIIKEALQEASTDTELAMISNYNTTGQIVIAGHTKAIERAEVILKEKGAKKLVRLNVQGPFHTPLLAIAGEKLEKELDNITIKKPNIPVITNVTAKEIDNIKDTLVAQIKSPVMWEQTIKELIEKGVDTFIEIGPTKTLSSFVKKIDKTLNIQNVEDIKSLEKTYENIKESL